MLGIYLTTLLTLLAAESRGLSVDFDTQVIPILTQAGCNSGACHGAAAGRGDFRLSLFGSRPDRDYEAIVKELGGRRTNLVSPDQSLLLAKPTQMLTHEGGLRIPPDSWEAEQLRTWIHQGAQRTSNRRLIQLTLESPRSHPATDLELMEVPAEFPLTMWAVFRDERSGDTYRENVTRLVVVTSNDPHSLEYQGPDNDESSEAGICRVHRGGRHTMTLRFLGRLETLTVTAPMEIRRDERTTNEGFPENWIDREIIATLRQLRLPVSPRADDLQLLRRLTLHLTGRLPTPEEIRDYLDASHETRYAQRVDTLLSSAEAEEYWTWYLSRLLRLRAPGGDRPALTAIHAWLREQWRAEVGWDETVASLLLAEGDSHDLGPATFYRQRGDARSQAEYASEVLWGIRLRCANCHDHPLDRWTQDDYHGLAAIFARLDRGRTVRPKSSGDVMNPATGEVAVARLPGERFLTEQEMEHGRLPLVQWARVAERPLFARAMVNRLWKSLMGRGLIEPTDDLRDTNPPTHPRLLERLEAEFRSEGYRLRPLLRAIVLSDAYQRGGATSGNEHDDRFYSHHRPTQLAPEILADAVSDVTGIWDPYEAHPRGTRAISLVDPLTASESLDRLGRCVQGESCDPLQPPSMQGIATRLHLLNGPLLNEKIAAPTGRLQRALERRRSGPDSSTMLIEEFYLRALGRYPREEERNFWSRQWNGATKAEARSVAEDFLWSLLNCREFVTN